MITVWKYSLETEAGRLLHTARDIGSGFFKTNNFIVLPYNLQLKTVNSVVFADLPYQQISRFWMATKYIDKTSVPVRQDLAVFKQVVGLLKEAKYKTLQYNHIQSLWEKAEQNVLKKIYKVLSNKKGDIKKIFIYPTAFGTSCSFNLINKKGEIHLYLRQDQGIHAIVEAIITSLTREDVYTNLDGLWQESEIITDFLVTQTSIGKLLQKYEPQSKYLATIKGVRIKQQARLIQESEEFYKKLGLPTFEKPFSYNGLMPELFGKTLQNLTIQERKVLLLLIKNQNNVTSIDDIANILFDSEANFSLYAIAKLIQRLRTKLEVNGISGTYIQTLRGKGYLLKN